MTRKYDFIILGGGPNGLEVGAYLAKAGEKVCILERRFECGGGLACEEITLPDFYHNTHAVYMMMVDYAPVYKDFRLEEDYFCKHIHPSLEIALPLSDGKSVGIYSDLERTCASIAKLSEKDAKAYKELYHLSKKCVEEFIAPATFAPPLPLLDQLLKIQSAEVGKTILEYTEKSPKAIVDEYFENEHVKALMLFLGTFWGVPYDQTGLGMLSLLYWDRAANYRLCKGGSHAPAQALNKIIHENGGVVLNQVRPQRIIIKDGAAVGVELPYEEIIEAEKAVISTLAPTQTFLELVGKENMTPEFTTKIESWQWEKHSLIGIHLALEEPPDFAAARLEPEMNKSFMYVLGYETPEDLTNDYDAFERGELPEKVNYYCCFPSVHDPEQAPPGRCVATIHRMAPYNLKDGVEKYYNYRFRQELAQQCVETLQKYAPNLTDDKIMERFVSTPLDLENKYKSMVQGSYKHGAYLPLQMAYQRPNEECSTTRTPINNLYVCGSSVYPGGCVIWGAGYLCANAIAEDLGVKKWWPEPEMVTKCKQAGLL